LVIKQVFHLPLRAMSGLAGSLVQLLGVDLMVPSYSQVCRRQQRLEVVIPRSASREEGFHVVVDSTGLKVFGEGEWKVRQHGYSKRRTWRKVHLCVDANLHEVVAALVTTNGVGDGEVLPALLDQFDDPIAQLSADGAYDSHGCYQAIEARGAKAAIPPREDAVPWPVTDQTPYAAQRNAALETIESQGRTAWKHLVGYHRRSLAETAMYRLKTLFGAGLKARRFGSQVAEVYARVAAMNTMTRLGMPESQPAF
jgi:Transposase DDE domain